METLDVVDDGRHNLSHEMMKEQFISNCRQCSVTSDCSDLDGGGACPDDGDPLASIVEAVVPA